jgi:RimJ/RimL family protein N-acetyltransferase
MAVLRPLVEGDVDALVALQRDGAVAGLGHIFPQHEHPFPAQAVRDRWLREVVDPDVECFAIVLGGRLAGFAATRGDEFLHFGTAVATWGSGLAGAAHDEVLEHFRAGGRAAVWLRVFEKNERAIRFYVRRGWTPTDQTSRTSFAPHPVLRRYERILA